MVRTPVNIQSVRIWVFRPDESFNTVGQYLLLTLSIFNLLEPTSMLSAGQFDDLTFLFFLKLETSRGTD